MPLPHRDPAITAYVRHVVIGLGNTEPTKTAARLGVSGAWVVNVRDGHRGVGLEALRKIAAADFGGSLDRLEATARVWSAAHPELLGAAVQDDHRVRVDANGAGASRQTRHRPLRTTARDAAERSSPGTTPTQDSNSARQHLENLRAARERLLDRGYPRDAVNEALLNTALGRPASGNTATSGATPNAPLELAPSAHNPSAHNPSAHNPAAHNPAAHNQALADTSDVLMVFDLAERQLIASGYQAHLHELLRRASPPHETAPRSRRAPPNPPANPAPHPQAASKTSPAQREQKTRPARPARRKHRP